MSSKRNKPEKPDELASSTDLELLQERIGYHFQEPDLLKRALAHNSWAVESEAVNNQTLEFLGDAVVDLVVSELLMRTHQERSEGELTRMRASIVNLHGLAAQAERLELGRWVLLGKGEERSGGRKKSRILADTFEAIVGAIFQDGGYEAAWAMVSQQLGPQIAEAESSGQDFKTEVQELSQRMYGHAPTYRVLEVSGPDHRRQYQVELCLENRPVSTGEGPNRKTAEQMAARDAAETLRRALEQAPVTQDEGTQAND